MKNLKDKIKKIIIDILMIIFIIFLIIILTSCDNNQTIDQYYSDISEYIDLETIAYNVTNIGFDRIYYDKNTGVMYYIGSFNGMQCGFPIYNSDGTLKLYEGD